MIINLIVFPVVIILAFLFGKKNTDKNRKWFIILVSLMILLVNCLRSLSVGPDTPSYYNRYMIIQDVSWSEVLGDFVFRYGTLSGDFDEGYNVLQKFISMFTSDFRIFTFVAQLIFFIPFGILLYRYCHNFLQLTFAFILYISLFNSLALSNARQVYAMGMGICSYLYLAEGKTFNAILFVLIAFFFHQSGLLCLIPIVLRYVPFKIMRTSTLLIFFLVPFVLGNTNQIIRFMGGLMDSERYVAYGMDEAHGGAIVYITMSLLMALFVVMVIKKEYVQKNLGNQCLYNMVLPTVFFCPLIYSNGSMIRITIYFQLYFCILFSYAIENVIIKSQRKFLYSVVIIILIIMNISTSQPYHFYWQETQSSFMINKSY